MNQQQNLFTDLPRGEQLASLRRLKLDSYKHRGRSVSGAICKSVLRAIDDRAGNRGCFASQATIADEVGCGVATVNRAIAALVAQDLITVDKPNPWSPNTHRVNWTAVRIASGLPGGHGRRQEQLLPTAKSALACDQDGSCLRPEPLAPTARQIVPLNANQTPTTNRDREESAAVAAEFVDLKKELFQWGLASASQAIDAARDRGMSIELIRELWLECGGNRDPQRWEPGRLKNILCGKTDAPLDHDEAVRRIAARAESSNRRDESAAEAIRSSLKNSGRIERAEPWITAGLTFRNLTAAGLERFATAVECDAGHRLDEIDRARDQTGPETDNRPPDVDARSVGRSDPTFQPRPPSTPSEDPFRPMGIPRTSLNQRRQEIARALLEIE